MEQIWHKTACDLSFHEHNCGQFQRVWFNYGSQGLQSNNSTKIITKQKWGGRLCLPISNIINWTHINSVVTLDILRYSNFVLEWDTTFCFEEHHEIKIEPRTCRCVVAGTWRKWHSSLIVKQISSWVRVQYFETPTKLSYLVSSSFESLLKLMVEDSFVESHRLVMEASFVSVIAKSFGKLFLRREDPT